MGSNTYTIVGDSFSKFISNSNIIAISDIEKRIFRKEKLDKNSYFLLGQGVSSERVNALLDSLELIPEYKGNFLFSKINKAGKQLVHKHNLVNSLILEPQQISENQFESEIKIDEQCDEMKDHQTGQHIAGMVLVEASRQMFLAVTELFFIKQHSVESYFVINSSTIEYLKFVFPLDIKIVYTVNKLDTSKTGILRFNVAMDIVQNDEVCAKMNYDFSAFESNFLMPKEDRAASLAIAYHQQQPEHSLAVSV